MSRTPFGPREFAEAVDVSREALDRLRAYAALLEKWQKTINLVSAGTMPDLWRRHMLDSAQLAALLPEPRDRGGPAVLDLGSGAGFPGLVLAVLTGRRVALVEADSRKCAFLGEAARVSGAPVSVENVRIETLRADPGRAPPAVLTARALAPLDELCAIAADLRPRACLFPKGRTWRAELAAARRRWSLAAETFASLTSGEARILRLSRIARAASGDPRPGAAARGAAA